MADNYHIEINGLIAADETSIASGVGGISYDGEDGVSFVFRARGVSDDNETPPRIEMHGHLVASSGTPDAEVPKGSLFTGQSFFVSDGIPFAALGEDSIGDTLPNLRSKGGSRFQVKLVFDSLLLLGEFSGEIFLRRALGNLIVHCGYP